MKIFVSYTSSDKEWAHWIGWTLLKAGHEPFVHEWEIGAGENIPRWMEERLTEADRLLGVFSDSYCEALYSQSERWAAYWQDPAGRSGFLVPIEVRKVTKWPVFIEPLKRLTLFEYNEDEAAKRLLDFLKRPVPPSEKPIFPGLRTTTTGSDAFTTGSEALISDQPPAFPASSPSVDQPPKEVPAAPLHRLDPDEMIRCVDDHEPRPVIFGRDDELKLAVEGLLEGKPVLVAGGPGMGKPQSLRPRYSTRA